ncbi:hypothetical protein IM792_20610 [Mucilaginibacter sp. JRF]|uniref:hypothetical protein n=1 Tax=Mucilaginibacter sp. JRF TaxID=2780088 RepID=UPI001882EFC2|nr:hypothetical protein [Mucilaginibacter sp. JRF]MBE9586863.1 hypothetical protein [Mucilaginibacter sp. JRF]
MKNLKYILAITVLGGTLAQACKQEVSYKQVREEVITLHDKLMADDEKIMDHRLKLDTLISPAILTKIKTDKPETDTAKLHADVNNLRVEMYMAGNNMSEWMQKFQPEQDGKSNAEAVAYFEGEKQKVKSLDSLYTSLLEQSNGYLKKYNIKVDTALGEHHHMEM